MPKYEHLGSKFSKTNVRFEMSIFEKGTGKILLRD